MKVAMSYSVNVAFGIDIKLDEELDALAKKWGATDGGSGSGFGWRDKDFDFDDEVKAEVFYRQVKEILIKKVGEEKCHVDFYTSEELED